MVISENIMITDDLRHDIDYLFNRDYQEELTDEQEDELAEYANNVIKKYPWKKVFKCASEYLYNNCKTPEEVINFAYLYYYYLWFKRKISNPYKFLGYFYYRINFETEKYDDNDILDTLATTILPKCGISEADLYYNPYYMPENDPKIIAEVEKYRNGK